MDGTATTERPLRYTHVTSSLLSFFPFLLAPPSPSPRCSFLPDRINVRTASTKDAPVGTARRGFVDVHPGRGNALVNDYLEAERRDELEQHE